jgi:hypothetical protein
VAQIFPEWSNKVFPVLLVAVLLGGMATVGFFWYFGSPKYTDIGYRPVQPVPYSHKLHAGDLGLDCRYCHIGVEVSASATIPPTQTCMNCHTLVKADSKKLAVVLESWTKGTPIEWIRVHDLPDYAYFNHSAHVIVGVGCASCHGNVAEMEEVMQVEALSMSWCLDCHRQPDEHLRPVDQVTNMKWTPPENQMLLARQIIEEKNISPPVDCSGCHR